MHACSRPLGAGSSLTACGRWHGDGSEYEVEAARVVEPTVTSARRGAVAEGRRAPRFPSGDDLDRLLCAGQFVVQEPDLSEFVCADRAQMLLKLEDCERRGIEPVVRWRRADATIMHHAGRPPVGWGIEAGAPA